MYRSSQNIYYLLSYNSVTNLHTSTLGNYPVIVRQTDRRTAMPKKNYTTTLLPDLVSNAAILKSQPLSINAVVYRLNLEPSFRNSNVRSSTFIAVSTWSEVLVESAVAADDVDKTLAASKACAHALSWD